jgi:hypothetical protein
MTAKQAKYFGKRRKRRARRAKAAPMRRRRRRAARVVASAPRRRRRRSGGARRPAVGYTVGTARIRRRKLNPHRRRYRRHSNPLNVRGIIGQVKPTLKAGAVGAVGALGLDALWGFASGNATLSQYLGNKYVGFAAKALGAVLVGTLGGKLMRGKGRDMAVGAMTVVTHDFLKTLLQTSMPTLFAAGGSVPLGGLGSYLSGSAPIVGTATVPQAYLPFGSYLSGSGDSGTTDGSSFNDDSMGMDPWGGSYSDGRSGYN